MNSEEFDIALYNDEFFAWHKQYAEGYSITNMDWLLVSNLCNNEYHIQNVVDVGCGIGSYLQSAIDHKKSVLGIEIALDYAKKYMREDVFNSCVQLDFTSEEVHKQLRVFNKYDLVMSFEVAEHIEPDKSEIFVKNLVSLLNQDGLLLFTAAPPGQLGCGHINCRPKEYWLELFLSHGLVYQRPIERLIALNWAQQGCPSYIADNLMVFVKKGSIREHININQ